MRVIFHNNLMEAFMPVKDIDVTKTGKVPRKYARVGDTFRWHATNTAITLWFPEIRLFGTNNLKVRGNTLSTALPVQKGCKKGTYRYAIYRHLPNDFAEGNSSPIIIIKDKESP